MKRISLFIIVTLLFHCGIKGVPLWMPISDDSSGKCIKITTIESNEYRYKAKIEILGYYENLKVINDSIYHQVTFDEPTSLSFVGEPSLPIISRLIAIPKGENFEVVIKDEKWSEDFFVGQMMPHQRSVLESEEAPPFEKSKAIYERDEYQTERFQIGELQNWRGINNRALNICPIKYMPKEGKMSLLKEFLLEISFDDTAKANPMNSKDMHLFLNRFNTVGSERFEQSRNSTESYDYLIIAGNIPGVLESQALADFRRWKAFKGYRTKVVSMYALGITDTLMKEYIVNEYDKGVRYVLFLGSYRKVRVHKYYNECLPYPGISDYWYGCIGDSTDVEADISIGRFPADNLSDLTNMINKTISYERTARSYGNEALLVAHYDKFPDLDSYRDCSEAIRTGNYSTPMSFTTAYGTSSDDGGGATNDSVLNEINEGKNVINYRGLGEEDRWPCWNSNVENFCGTEINELNNTTNDVYFCIASKLGGVSMDTCFVEYFMRSNHGAVGMITAADATYYEQNNSFDQNLFIKLLNENVYNIGDLNVAAHLATIGSETGMGREQAIFGAFNFFCYSDPSLEIITDNTSNFDNYTLSLNGQDLTIDCNNTNGYRVSIVNENDSLTSVVNSTNNICSFPIPSENFYVVLNKHNYVPRIIYVNVTDSDIQNKVFDEKGVDYYYIKDATIRAGYDVTNAIPYGNVTIDNGSKLSINKKKGAYIKNGFRCKIGGELQIK